MGWRRMTHKQENKWEHWTFTLDPSLAQEVRDYMDALGTESRSEAIRVLVGAGLESLAASQTALVTAITSSAKAAALSRWTQIIIAAVDTFKDPQFLTGKYPYPIHQLEDVSDEDVDNS